MEKYLQTVPIYQQIVQKLLHKIESGEWPNHTKLPDEVELASRLQVSRGTLRKAIAQLSSQGLLTRIPGKGTFVQSGPMEQQLASVLVSTSEELERQNKSYRTVVLQKTIIAPDPKLRSLLKVAQDTPVLFLERLRFVDDFPTIYLKNYVPLSFCPGIMQDDLEHEKLFDLLENKYANPVLWGQRYFRAVAAVGDVASNLGVVAGSPVMALEQTAFTSLGVPIEHSNVWLDSSRFELMAVLTRK